MFDTMTITKIVGALCGALLVYLLGTWVADSLYATHAEGHGEHAEGELTQAYTIDTGAAAPTEGAAEGPSFDELFATADVAAGEKIFGKCASCHKVDGNNAVGPHLNGVVGRAKASVEGFGYSEALLAMAGENWEPAKMNEFLTNPKAYAKGTKMSFAGLPKAQDRANVIAYLATLK